MHPSTLVPFAHEPWQQPLTQNYLRLPFETQPKASLCKRNIVKCKPTPSTTQTSKKPKPSSFEPTFDEKDMMVTKALIFFEKDAAEMIRQERNSSYAYESVDISRFGRSQVE